MIEQKKGMNNYVSKQIKKVLLLDGWVHAKRSEVA